MADRLELSIEGSSDVLCVRVEGRLSAATVNYFVREIDAAIGDRTCAVRAVILNCEKLNHVSGTGWHNVLLLGRTLAGRDARLLLTSLSPSLHNLFDNVNFLGFLSVHKTAAEAHASLSHR